MPASARRSTHPPRGDGVDAAPASSDGIRLARQPAALALVRVALARGRKLLGSSPAAGCASRPPRGSRARAPVLRRRRRRARVARAAARGSRALARGARPLPGAREHYHAFADLRRPRASPGVRPAPATRARASVRDARAARLRGARAERAGDCGARRDGRARRPSAASCGSRAARARGRAAARGARGDARALTGSPRGAGPATGWTCARAPGRRRDAHPASTLPAG